MLSQVFVNVLGPNKYGRVQYQPRIVSQSSCYDKQCASDLRYRVVMHEEIACTTTQQFWHVQARLKRQEEMLRSLQEVVYRFIGQLGLARHRGGI